MIENTVNERTNKQKRDEEETKSLVLKFDLT